MGRRPSLYWQYVTSTKTKGEVVVEWQCNFCKSIFTGGATRIKPHLEGIKNQGISICEKIEEYRRCNQRHDNNTANSNNPQEGDSEHAEARLIGTTQEGNDALINTQASEPIIEPQLFCQPDLEKNNEISLSIPSSSKFHSLTTSDKLYLDTTFASFEKLVTGSAMSNNPSEAVNETIPAEDVHEPLPLPESQSRKKRRREVMGNSVSTGQADIGMTSPCSATNINPPEGHGESPKTMDPNLPPSYPDIATSSHRQPQAGITGAILNLAGSGNPRPERAQINHNTNGPTSDDGAQLAAYYNSGTQHIQGLTNQTGYVKGNGNGIINLGTLGNSAVTQSQSVADLQAKVDALQRLVGLVDRMGDGRTENGSATQPNSSAPTPLRGENHGLGKYSNTDEQSIKGLTNQTGIIEGNFNGLVNLGCSDL